MIIYRLVLMFIVFVCVVGCKDAPLDIRERLLASEPIASSAETRIQRTKFAYLGKVDTADAKIIYVCEVRTIVTGMPSPRGQGSIHFFDSSFRFIGSEDCTLTPPLWCQGSRIFLYGAATDGESKWNVIDLSEGFAERKRMLIPTYGSYTS